MAQHPHPPQVVEEYVVLSLQEVPHQLTPIGHIGPVALDTPLVITHCPGHISYQKTCLASVFNTFHVIYSLLQV